MLTLSNADIISRFSQVADFKAKAKSGTTTTLVNDNSDFTDAVPGYFNSMYICFLSGSNKGVDRLITNFDDITGTFTFDALDNSVDNTTLFAIVENGFINYSEDAFNFIQEKVKNDGKDIDLFLTTEQLKELHIYKTFDLICQDKFHDTTDEDLFYGRHVHYNNLFESTYQKLKADYDSNEDGIIEEDEKLQGGSYGVLRR